MFVDLREGELHCRMVEDSEEVQLTALLEGQMRTLNRAKSESASKALQRLLKAVGKKKSKRDKKAREDVDSGAADVQVHSADGALYSTEQLSAFTNAELWRDGVHVTVCGARLVVVVNPPAITGDVRAFPKKPMLVGYPIIASALGVEFADDVRFVWTHLPSGEKKGQGQGQEQEQGKIEEQAEAFAYVGRVFTPTAEHRNRRVKLHATPFRRTGAESESEREYVWGRTHVFYCSGEVQDAPSPCMSIVRREWLQAQHTARDGFRVMTYNILADAFATSDFSQTQLYPYVRQEHLDTSYRCQIMLREVEDHMPDIVCLQECDRSVFRAYLAPMLERSGMQGFYLNKAGGIAEGCATFVRSSSFRVVHVVPMELKKVLRILPSLEELYAAMPHIQDIIGGKLTTVAQILVLQPVHDAHKGRRLLVANTHLFYYPWANYVRMLQTHVIVRVLEEIKNRLLAGASLPIGYSLHACSVPELVENEQTYEEVLPWVQRGMQEGIPPEEEQQLCSAQSQPDTLIAVGRVEQVSVCFCGDLNSTPGDGSIEYIRSGHLPSEHDNWSSVHQFRWGQNFFKDERAVEEQAAPAGVEDPSPRTRSRAPIDPELSKIMPVLRHGLGLRFASGFPLFTNFTPGFKDVLDYVITDDATLEVVSVAPMPSSEVCSENVGLPSRVFPSDHLSVCVDLRFRAEEQLP